MVPLLTISTAPTISASPGWWDNNWTKRSTVTIPIRNPENFQIKIVIPSYISTSDYPSIRFLENEDSGVLPYWIEKSESSYMNVAWVRRLENNDNTIYMYYGNAGASSAENGDNVFLFYDDFQGANSGKWGVYGNGTKSFDATVLHLVGQDGDKARVEGQFSGLAGQQDWTGTAKTIEVRYKNASSYRGGLLLNGSGWSNVEQACIFDGPRFWLDGNQPQSGYTLNDRFWIAKADMWGSDGAQTTTTFSWGQNDENLEKIWWRFSKGKDWTNANGGDYVDKIVLAAWDSSSSSYYFDWIFMRRDDNRGMGTSVEPADIYGYVDQSYTTIFSAYFNDATDTAAQYDSWYGATTAWAALSSGPGCELNS